MCQISKLRKQIDAHKKKNDSEKNYLYLCTQVSGLQEQVSKLQTLMEDLTDKINKVYEQKNQLRRNYSFLRKEISAEENIILDTTNLPKTNSVTSTHQTEHQNLCKKLSSEIIRKRSKSPESSEKINAELPAKQPRYSRYKVNELDNSVHDEHRKFMKREYIKQKCLSTEYRQKENLKQRDCDAQRRSSTEFREKRRIRNKGSIMHKDGHQLNSEKRRIRNKGSTMYKGGHQLNSEKRKT